MWQFDYSQPYSSSPTRTFDSNELTFDSWNRPAWFICAPLDCLCCQIFVCLFSFPLANVELVQNCCRIFFPDVCWKRSAFLYWFDVDWCFVSTQPNTQSPPWIDSKVVYLSKDDHFSCCSIIKVRLKTYNSGVMSSRPWWQEQFFGHNYFDSKRDSPYFRWLTYLGSSQHCFRCVHPCLSRLLFVSMTWLTSKCSGVGVGHTCSPRVSSPDVCISNSGRK